MQTRAITSKTTSTDQSEETVEFTANQIKLSLPEKYSDSMANHKSISLSTRWLRDRCLCPECFQRQQRSLKRVEAGFEPAKQRINTATKNDNANTLKITWSDGHRSAYDMNYIAHHVVNTMPRPEISKRYLWTVNDLKKEGGPVELIFNDVIKNTETQRQLGDAILRFGFVQIVDAPVERKSLSDLLNVVGGSMSTLFSEADDATMDLTNNDLQNDLGWSDKRVPGHTDLSFCHNPSALVGLHLLQHDGTGGDLAIMDAFQIVERIRRESSTQFRHLVYSPVLWKYITPQVEEQLVSTILRLDPATQDCLQFKWSPVYIYPLHTDAVDETESLYDTLAHLYNEIHINPENRYLFSPRQGTITLFDNWRMVHERVTPFSGKRIMHVGDVPRDNWMTTARKLGIL